MHALPAHHAQRAGEHEQLLIYQPPPRHIERLKIGGKVYVLIGVARRGKLALRAQLLRQHVLHTIRAGSQPLLHALQHHTLAQPGAQLVYRHDAPGHAALRALLLVHGVCHRAPPAVLFNLAVEHVSLTARYLIFYIALVEIGYIDRSAVVHGAEFYQLHPAPYAHKARLIRHRSKDAHRLLIRRLRDAAHGASVLIAAGKVGDEVIERKDAKLIESLRLFLAYTLYVSYICR